MKFYVYELIDPRNNKPFYVGKGCKLRMYSHVKDVKRGQIPHKNLKLFNKINKILNLELKIQYKKLHNNITNKESYTLEIERIKQIGINNLCNLTYGGEGLNPTEEIKQKISKTKRGSIPWNKGKRGLQVAWNKGLTKETSDSVRKYSETKIKNGKTKGRVTWNKGLIVPMSDRPGWIEVNCFSCNRKIWKRKNKLVVNPTCSKKCHGAKMRKAA